MHASKPQKPRYNNKKATSRKTDGFGPSGESRTHGLLNPIQARYQTALHPDVSLRRHVILYPVNGNLSIDFFDFCESFCRNLFVGAVLPQWAGILRKVHKQIPFILGGSHIYPPYPYRRNAEKSFLCRESLPVMRKIRHCACGVCTAQMQIRLRSPAEHTQCQSARYHQ